MKLLASILPYVKPNADLSERFEGAVVAQESLNTTHEWYTSETGDIRMCAIHWSPSDDAHTVVCGAFVGCMMMHCTATLDYPIEMGVNYLDAVREEIRMGRYVLGDEIEALSVKIGYMEPVNPEHHPALMVCGLGIDKQGNGYIEIVVTIDDATPTISRLLWDIYGAEMHPLIRYAPKDVNNPTPVPDDNNPAMWSHFLNSMRSA